MIELLLLLLIVVGVYGYYSEKELWNNGYSKLGYKWEQFDTDSQGGRGYTDNHGNYCWISWNVDK